MSKKQGKSNCNTRKIPVTVNEKFVKANDNSELADATSYRSLIGSLPFLAKQTCPVDLYECNILSPFMDKCTKADMPGAKRFLRNLHGTSKLKIVYQMQEYSVLLGESDGDWNGDQNHWK